MDGIKVELLINEMATEDQLYKLNSPDILHIATHGYWSRLENGSTDNYRSFNAMINSGILLAGVTNYYKAAIKPDSHDGILTA